MKLHWSPLSPYVRKVMIVLHETAQVDDVQQIRSVVALSSPPNPAVMADNPLGKIPVLVTDEGVALFDSRVICEYLDQLAGAGLFPENIDARTQALCWQALGDGMTDNLLLWRTELTRPAGPWQAIMDGWRAKIRASMARLEAEAAQLGDAPFGIGQIAVVCALGQLDFRWRDSDWRTHFPDLAALERQWSQRDSVRKTVVVSDKAQDDGLTLGQLSFVRN